MKTLTKEKHIANVPARWRAQYGHGRWLSDYKKQDIQNKLDSVLPNQDKYEEIIGNASWTRLECDSCGKDVEIVVFIKARASEEYGESAICKNCLEKYLKTITEDARSGQGETGEHLTTEQAQNAGKQIMQSGRASCVGRTVGGNFSHS
jgi:hypothetical protein